jgi:hypothetical protein
VDLLSSFLKAVDDFVSSTGLAGIAALFTLLLALLGAILAARRARSSANDARESASVATRTLHRRTNQYASDLVLKSDEALIAHPELAIYFKDEDAVLPTDEPDRALVLAIAEMRLDVAEAIWDHHDEFKPDDEEAWREWIHYMIQVSPALQDEEVMDVDFYPSTRSLLASNGCTNPKEHAWAVDKGRELARRDLEQGVAKVRRLENLLHAAEKAYGARWRIVGRDPETQFLERKKVAAQRDLGEALSQLATIELRCRVARALPVLAAARMDIQATEASTESDEFGRMSLSAMDKAIDAMRVRVCKLAGASSKLLDPRPRRARIRDRIMGEPAPTFLTRDVRDLVAQPEYSNYFAEGRRTTVADLMKRVDPNERIPGDEEVA